MLEPDDFQVITCLSSSGPFAQVELARYDYGLLLGEQQASGKLLVIKTVERTWGYKMRLQQAPAHELAILRLSRSSPSAPIPLLVGSMLSETHFHLVLAYASGGDLWSFLEEADAGIDEKLVVRWMAEAIEAIEWLHGQGWSHRDIKPHNLLIDPGGRLLLTDFGSAAPLANGRDVARKYTKVLIGTPDYIAPEILHSAELLASSSFSFDADTVSEEDHLRAYGAEVDFWSLGVVIYEVGASA